MEKKVIKFYYFDKFLGKFNCPERSTIEDRNKIAADNGVSEWTHFVIVDSNRNKTMGVRLNETKRDLRGERGEYSTADFLPLPTGEYFVWIYPDCKTVTIKVDK